ncbi:MAG: hypothetical protein HDQ87_09130 [Clostridia bacterium]|nr:hypothetical protein [Clostridia bacterium]
MRERISSFLIHAFVVPVAQFLNVNCSDQQDVEASLLRPVLSQMTAKLDQIDDLILSRARASLADLADTYRSIVAQVERAVGATVSLEMRDEFAPQIDNLFGKTARQLRRLYELRQEQMGEPCGELAASAEECLRRVFLCIPSQERIIHALGNGAKDQHEILRDLATETRLRIIDEFLALNTVLDSVISSMKQSVVDVLARSDKGRLGQLIGDGCDDGPNAWLEQLRDRLQAEQYPLLCGAIQPLIDFDLRVENFLIYKVRSALAPIDWREKKQVPALMNAPYDVDELAKEMREVLEDAVERVHRGIRAALDDYYEFPNTAMYAVLRDFADRAIDMEDETGRSVEHEWKRLYGKMIPMIWPDEYHAKARAADQAETWREITESLRVNNTGSFFKLD